MAAEIEEHKMANQIYKVVEISSVSDVELEETINQWVGEGWQFEGIQFAMRESSKRPAMAFVLFVRSEAT